MELKGDHFASIEEIQTAVMNKSNSIKKDDFSKALKRLKDLKDRANQGIQYNGDYFEQKMC